MRNLHEKIPQRDHLEEKHNLHDLSPNLSDNQIEKSQEIPHVTFSQTSDDCRRLQTRSITTSTTSIIRSDKRRTRQRHRVVDRSDIVKQRSPYATDNTVDTSSGGVRKKIDPTFNIVVVVRADPILVLPWPVSASVLDRSSPRNRDRLAISLRRCGAAAGRDSFPALSQPAII